MVGALILGFVAGALARFLVPRDAFRKMSGPASWGVSILRKRNAASDASPQV